MAKQSELPGMEAPRIEELDNAVEDFWEAQKEAKKAAEALKEAKVTLRELAKKHGLSTYRDTSREPALVLILREAEERVSVVQAVAPAPVDVEEDAEGLVDEGEGVEVS